MKTGPTLRTTQMWLFLSLLNELLKMRILLSTCLIKERELRFCKSEETTFLNVTKNDNLLIPAEDT